jgi:hypothetical protein
MRQNRLNECQKEFGQSRQGQLAAPLTAKDLGGQGIARSRSVEYAAKAVWRLGFDLPQALADIYVI